MTEPPSPAASLIPRSRPPLQAFLWFQTGLRLFKRAPVRWCALGAITLASKLLLELVPGVGRAAAEVIVPVIECGLLLGAAALDRGSPLELRYAFAAFRAPPGALAAIVVASLVVSAAEFGVAHELAGANLLADPSDPRLTPDVLLTVIATATFVSLPLLFVPMAALFEDAGFVRAFARSLQGFAVNAASLVLFGVLSLALTLVGLLTFWIGLIAVFPLIAAASFAAWSDIYASPESVRTY
ncbi:MAG TPA: hypothetical protein VMQ50_03040 [Casimicrobiaceae bacterium]|nr:hypothetical protein [Casimicrobiaceae bacterium]